MFKGKRPTKIEDRRKGLQQYIRDLAKIDIVRNSRPFKNFLEIDRHLEQAGIVPQSGENTVATAGSVTAA